LCAIRHSILPQSGCYSRSNFFSYQCLVDNTTSPINFSKIRGNNYLEFTSCSPFSKRKKMPIKSYVLIGWANKGSKESTCSHMFQIHWEQAKKKKNTTIQSEIWKQDITFDITLIFMDFFIETTSWIKHMSNSEGDFVKWK